VVPDEEENKLLKDKEDRANKFDFIHREIQVLGIDIFDVLVSHGFD
jgi:hypothetical protein